MASSGNFCTLNPLTQPNAGTFSEGNLLFEHTASAWRSTLGTLGMTSGKWYWEAYQKEDVSGNGFPVGIYDADSGKFASNQAGDYLGQATSTYGNNYVAYTNSGSYSEKRNNGSNSNMTLSAGASGDVWQCALDIDNGKIWFGKNNTWDNSGNPATGSNASFTSVPTTTWMPVTCSYNTSNSEDYPQNYGQDSSFAGRITAGGNADENGFGDFKYAPPTGFLALCSANLPISADIDPAQTDDDIPTKQFGVATWTGNSTDDRAISLGMQPDLIVIKEKGYANNWYWIDSTRGVNNTLQTNTTAATHVDTGVLNAFTSTGITIGTSGGSNNSSDTYCAWGWRANGGTTSTNDEGSLDSTVQANTKAGFSIVETPNFSGSCTLGHGLTKAPEFVIHKLTASGNNWNAWHTGLSGAGYIIRLNSTAAETTGSHFNSTAPTADVFSMGASLAGSGVGICYLWHSVEGYSKFGTYVGNADADGPFIYTGFRPAKYFVKNVTAVNGWFIYDKLRDGFNDQNDTLSWQDSTAEDNTYEHDILSNGFKIRDSNNATNQSGQTFIYGAWSDVPFKYNNAR